tara:strand:- start:22984 stop:23250 length:267 start_codon:yes stop_codon:yes gene_type:complete
MSGGITAAGVAAAASVVSTIYTLTKSSDGGGGAAAAPVAPVVTEPIKTPTPNDASTKAAERASIAEQLRRRGRASTILTDTGATDTLG